MIESGEVVGVIVPGDGRLRFCHVLSPVIDAGDWVVVTGPLGCEPGQIMFTADRVDVPPSAELNSSVSRLMTDAEVAQLDACIARAQSLVEKARRAVSMIDAGVQLIGLRFTLGGSTIICTCSAQAVRPPANLASDLGDALGCPVRIEWSDYPAQTFGSLGRVRAKSADSNQAIRDRLGIGASMRGTATGRWPRLASRVVTPKGRGEVLAVSVRHNTATVRLDSGQEIDVPIEDLSKRSK